MSATDEPGDTTQFIEKMDGQLLGWDQPAARLREALDYDHFRLYAQPVLALAPPGGIVLAEVLVRLREEERTERARERCKETELTEHRHSPCCWKRRWTEGTVSHGETETNRGGR